MVLAGTGPRPPRLFGYGASGHRRAVRLIADYLREARPKLVISGMALGWDMALASAAVMLDIPFDAYCPGPWQPNRWPSESRCQWETALSHARSIHYTTEEGYHPRFMQIRNQEMVDAANIILTYWDGTPSGGTYNCLQYARSVDRPIVNLYNTGE